MTIDQLIAAGLCWLCEGSGKMAVAICSPPTNTVRMEGWPCDVCKGTGKAVGDEQRQVGLGEPE